MVDSDYSMEIYKSKKNKCWKSDEKTRNVNICF